MNSSNLDLSYRQCEMAMLIALLGKVKEIHVTKLAKNIGVDRKNPQFYNLMSTLEDAGIVRDIRKEGAFKIITININELRDFLWNIPRLEIVKKYFEEVHYLFK